MSLPPGPRLPRSLQTALYGLRPIGFVQACRDRYGDVFTMDVAPVGKLVCFCAPEGARAIYKGNPEVLRSGEYSRTLIPEAVIPEDTKAYGGPRSVLFLDGEEHLRDRHVLQGAFDRSAVEGYRELIEQITVEQLEGLPHGRTFALRDVTYRIALSVMLRGPLAMAPSQRLQRLLETIPRLFSFSPMLLAIPALRGWLGPLSPRARFMRLRSEVEQLLASEIESRRASEDSEATDAIVSLLRASRCDGRPLSVVEIRDELQVLTMVATESTASAAAWGIERVLRNDDTHDRLRAELESGREELLDAVVKETLRTSPVLMGTGRRVLADCVLAGHRIPAGTMVRVAIPLLHSSPAAYDDPERFCPARFGGDPPAPYTWMPFGGGVRRCIGANLAFTELKIVLATALQRLDLRVRGKRSERARFRSVFMAPARGSRVMQVGH